MFTAHALVVPTRAGRGRGPDQLAAEAAEAPRAFPGCELFLAAIEEHEPRRVVIVEDWTGGMALGAHVGSEQPAELMERVGSCFAVFSARRTRRRSGSGRETPRPHPSRFAGPTATELDAFVGTLERVDANLETLMGEGSSSGGGE